MANEPRRCTPDMNDRISADIPTCRMFEMGDGIETVQACGDISGLSFRRGRRARRHDIREVVETRTEALAVQTR